MKESAKLLTPFNIRIIRTSLNLTQRELAKRCGLSIQFMWYIEKGERKITIDTEQKLIKAFGLSKGKLNTIIDIANNLQSVVTD